MTAEDDLANLRAERDRLAAKVERLTAALRPFATLGAALPEHYNREQLGPGHPRFWYEIDPAHIWNARDAVFKNPA